MARFAVQIEAKDWDGEGGQKKFFLENISESSITKSLTITTHPVIGGEEIADHFYKNPATLNFSGTISLNSNKTEITEGVTFGKNNPQELGRFQKIFEKIQSEGLLCDIVKIQRGEDGGYRFRKQDNMVLSSITWTEGINSLGFEMSWTQALIVEQTNFATSSNGGTTGDTDVNNSQVESDGNLPSIESPNLSSFSETVINWTQVEADFVRDLQIFGYLKKDVIDFVVSYGGHIPDTTLTEEQQLRLFKVCAIAQIIKDSSSSRIDTNRVFVFRSAASTQRGKRAFSTKSKTLLEVATKLGLFIWEIHTKFVEKYADMIVYRITSNKEQDIYLQIDNRSYICKIRYDNTNERWYLRVEKSDEPAPVGGITNLNSCITDYEQATNSNRLFRDEGGSYVHIIRIPSKYYTFDLTNYCLVVSPSNFSPDKLNEEINVILKEYVGNL